jgi:RimJ/RimL family protein N-acetyltransferase
MTEIGFRPLAEDDLLLLFTWLSRPHVKKWYSPEPGSFAEFAAKYMPRTDPESSVKAFVIVVNGADAGYIQAYFIDRFPAYERLIGCEEGVVGLDLFLGDDWRTRHGVGPQVIQRFVDEILFGRYGAAACVAGPNEGNDGSIHAFEKAGFRRWKTVTNERGERECVLRVERPPQ